MADDVLVGTRLRFRRSLQFQQGSNGNDPLQRILQHDVGLSRHFPVFQVDGALQRQQGGIGQGKGADIVFQRQAAGLAHLR